jgi:hypothetical protein
MKIKAQRNPNVREKVDPFESSKEKAPAII